jgi:hypothetical protein
MALTTVNPALLDTQAQYTGFKNRIINGAMVISQYNGTSSVTPTNASYPIDRWRAYLSQASKYSVQQNAGSVTPPAGFTNYLGVTSLSAYSVGASEFFSVQQFIEGFNVADLGWGTANAQPVTLSFRVYSSLTGTFGGVLQNDAQNRSYPFTYAVPSANTWTTISITVAGDTSGTWLTNNGRGIAVWFGLGAGSTVSGTAGAWAGAGYYSATGATSIVGTSGATFYITGVQLEKGSTATAFDYRPIGTELALCQRYYYFIDSFSAGGNSTALILAKFSTDYNNYVVIINHPQTMRTSPSVIIESGMRAHKPGVSIEAATFTASAATTSTAYISCIPSTSTASAYLVFIDGDGVTTKKIFVSAEL